MIELLPDLPDKVVGIIASGQVTAGDYEDVVTPTDEELMIARSVNRILDLGK